MIRQDRTPHLPDRTGARPLGYDGFRAVRRATTVGRITPLLASDESFISIGGGSSHDACKGARVSVAHDDASVTTLAIDGPVLYYSCPLDYTAQCGFDVLAHASEPYVSRLNFHPSLGNALHAIKLCAENLREAVWNPQSLPGREGMMHAQYIAAQAFNSGGLGIIHPISHAVSAFYDTHHGLNNAIALPGVWAFNMPVAYRRFADIARQMGIDTHGMTDIQAARAALEAAIQLLRDVGIPERFVDVTQDSYSKNRLGVGPTAFYENSPTITGDAADVDRITNHVLGDACTPGNAKECTFETVRPVVEHCMTGDLDDLLS